MVIHCRAVNQFSLCLCMIKYFTMGKFISLVAAFTICFAVSPAMELAEEVFASFKVVPDVVRQAPPHLLRIEYPSGAVVSEGNELTPTQVKDQPRVYWMGKNNVYYTLCLTDPDAPSRAKPSRREWHHWLVGNIPGSNIEEGEVLTAYVGSGPPKNTGLHRYVFLVYQQPGKIQFTEKHLSNKTGSGRANFSIARFAKKYEFGNPIGGNFYQAQYDDYVPTLHKQLTL